MRNKYYGILVELEGLNVLVDESAMEGRGEKPILFTTRKEAEAALKHLKCKTNPEQSAMRITELELDFVASRNYNFRVVALKTGFQPKGTGSAG